MLYSLQGLPGTDCEGAVIPLPAAGLAAGRAKVEVSVAGTYRLYQAQQPKEAQGGLMEAPLPQATEELIHLAPATGQGQPATAVLSLPSAER